MTHQPFHEHPFQVCVPGEGLFVSFIHRGAFQSPAGGWVSPDNTLLVCPACQRSWASLAYTDRRAWLYPYPAFCRDCPFEDWRKGVPGSVLLNYGLGHTLDTELLERLPEPLLRREFDLHLAWFTRQESNA